MPQGSTCTGSDAEHYLRCSCDDASTTRLRPCCPGEVTPDILDWLSGIKTKDLDGTKFGLSPSIMVDLLEGKTDLSMFGTLTLPSSDAMKQASPDVLDRLHAIKEVDLTKDKVGFNVEGKGRQRVRVGRVG